MDRLDDRVRRRGQEAIDEVRPGDRLGLRAPVAFELGPDASEGEERPVVVEGEPDDILFFVSGFGSGAYSAKLLSGTKQRVRAQGWRLG